MHPASTAGSCQTEFVADVTVRWIECEDGESTEEKEKNVSGF